MTKKEKAVIGKKRKRKEGDGKNRRGKGETAGDGRSVEIQRCRFIRWEVSGGVAAASSKDVLAVLRENGVVEVRSVKGRNRVLGFFGGVGTELVSVAVLGRAVLVGGLDGFVRRFDYNRRTCDRSVDVGGGAVWCLATAPSDSRVACGCEDGSVRILFSDDTQYEVTLLSKGKKRVTSVCWSEKGDVLFAGDAGGGIRRMNASTGRALVSGEIASRREKVVIWSLVSQGSVVVSGDSRGLVTVWHAEMLLAEKELQVEGLQGDIYALCGLKDSIFVGAANGSVGLISMTEQGGWMVQRGRRLHFNDVRAIIPLGNREKVVTVGNDSLLVVYSLDRFLQDRKGRRILPSLGPEGMPAVDVRYGTALARYRDRVELWRLPGDADTPRVPKMLLRVNPGDLGGALVAAAVSPKLTSLVISGFARMSIFEMTLGDQPSAKVAATMLPAARWVSYIGDNKVACISQDGEEVRIMDTTGVVERRWSARKLLPQQGGLIPSSIFKMLDTKEDGTMVLLTSNRLVAYIDTTKKSPKCVILPSSTGPRVLALNPNDKTLAVLGDNWLRVTRYGGKSESTETPLPELAKAQASGVSCVESSGTWAVYGHNFAAIVRESERSGKRGSKTTKIPLDRGNGLIGMGAVRLGSVATVQSTWDDVLESLPMSLPRKLFAT